jgi:RHS repeat-associated protein
VPLIVAPYGSQLKKTGVASDPLFRWVGAKGYRSTERMFSEIYIRARAYTSMTGRWTTVDPLWPAEPPFEYAKSCPAQNVDVTGLCPSWMLQIPVTGVAICAAWDVTQKLSDPKVTDKHKVKNCGRRQPTVEKHLRDVCDDRLPQLPVGPLRDCMIKRCANVEITCGGRSCFDEDVFGFTPGDPGTSRVGIHICPGAFKKENAGCLGKTIIHEMCHSCGEAGMPPGADIDDYCQSIADGLYGPGKKKCPD